MEMRRSISAVGKAKGDVGLGLKYTLFLQHTIM